uniref:Protein tweety homolog n=1 Tax=Mastacembelus armatus TaxID=205130 RepID=A0A7N8X4G7_9TELE
MTTVPSYTPSLWVRVCHALPRLDLTMQMRDNIFVPDSWEYQQTLLVLSSLSAIALVISLLVVLSFLIHYCCCHRGDRSHGYGGKKGRGICCVTWVAVAAVTLVAIGIGFYGNSEANDGMYQLTSSLLTANYTLASIDLLVNTITGLQLSVSGPLTTMEELFTGSKPFLVSTRNCRRLSDNVISLISSISLAHICCMWCLCVCLHCRWLSYVLLLLLDLIVCLFILLGLAKQARWLLILMTVLAWLALFLSWGSLGLETATVVVSRPRKTVMVSGARTLLTQSQRALSNIHTHLSSLDRNALTQFPKAEKSLREVQQILNSTEGNFHQLVALLNCRGLNKDYIDSLKGLCYDGMEGLLYLSLYSFLSALAFTAILCSLPGAWRSFPSESEEYEDSDSESEDPFTSHQARRQTASGSQRGAMTPFYNYPGAGWTPPFSSAPPLP